MTVGISESQPRVKHGFWFSSLFEKVRKRNTENTKDELGTRKEQEKSDGLKCSKNQITRFM